MLSHGNGKTMNDVRSLPRVTWTNTEWEMIAQELQTRYPARRTHVWSNFEYTMDEFEEAMEAVIRQERHKSFDSFSDVMQPLFDAFKRKKMEAKMVSEPKSFNVHVDAAGRIFWDNNEYKLIFKELDRIAPGWRNSDMQNLTRKDVKKAQEIFSEDRQRTFKQVDGFKVIAAKLLAQFSKEAKEEAEKHAIVEFENGQIAVPPERKSDQYSAIATAMHDAFKAPENERKKYKTRVAWTDDEWVGIAKEMRKQNPFENFFTQQFNVIDLPAVRDAARVAIAAERRRDIKASAGLREPLLAAFKMLWIELNTEPEEEPEPTVAKPQIPVIQAEEIKFEREDAPQFAQVQHAMQSVGGDFAQRMMHAATPLMQMLMAEVAKQIAPELIKAFSPMLEAAIADMKQAAKPVMLPRAEPTVFGQMKPVTVASSLVAETTIAVPVEKPKKPKIALLCPPGVHHMDVERAFTEYDFVWIEDGRGIKEIGTKCELFVACNVCMTVSNKASVKAHVPSEKFRTVHGGTSSVKRLINVWHAAKSTHI